MTELVALAVFSFVSAATPGPNNVLLWASGVQFGLRGTLPHVAGTALGIGTMAVAAAAGIGLVITAVPQLGWALRILGSVYLLYLAYQVAGSRAVRQAEVARPLRLGQAAAFQYVNPKAWVFVVAALTAFQPSRLPVVVGSGLMVLTMMVVVLPAALLWAAGGHLLQPLMSGAGASRLMSLVLAVLLVGTVAYLWV